MSSRVKTTVVYRQVEGGETELTIGGAFESISDGGTTKAGQPITIVTNKRGFAYRVIGRREDVARELGFGRAA